MEETDYLEWLESAKKDLGRARRAYADRDYPEAVLKLQMAEEKVSKSLILGLRFLPEKDEPAVAMRDVLGKDFGKLNLRYFGHNWHEKYFRIGTQLKLREARIAGEDVDTVVTKIEELHKLFSENPNPSKRDLIGWLEVGKLTFSFYRSRKARGRFKNETEVHRFLGSFVCLYNLQLLAFLNSYLWRHHTLAAYPGNAKRGSHFKYDESMPLVAAFEDLVIYLNNIVVIALESLPDFGAFINQGKHDRLVPTRWANSRDASKMANPTP